MEDKRKATILIHSISKANKMLDGLDHHDRIIDVKTTGTIAYQVRDRINSWRRELRKIDDKDKMAKQQVAMLEHASINACLSRLLSNNNFNDNVTIDNSKPQIKFRPNQYRQKGSYFGTVQITVGYMWKRKVFDKIHTANNRFPGYICLKATEYRTNASGVRLYAATVFNCNDRKVKEGYIGQSKYGKELCAFHNDRSEAIKAGTKLAAAGLSENLGEPK